jgi:succinylglutamic semialdehyde dehydrogenase
MATFSSIDPATGATVWTGLSADAGAVALAVTAARRAFPAWADLSVADREGVLRRFARELESHRAELAQAISREVGKPPWEAQAEVGSMITKIDFAVAGHARRTAEFGQGNAVTRFRPHGVCAVFGPFNFPGHLPNGHIVPALLAGNTVVFKPSEHAPLVAELTAAAWHRAGLPDGVLNLVQGGRETGAALAVHPGLDGLFFTGSARTGLWLAEHFARTPERILALELGGNNPLVVWSARDLAAAALIVVQSAYATAGQRCTCARRLIVPAGPAGEAVIDAVIARLGHVRTGAWTEKPEPFLGPVVSAAAARAVLAAEAQLVSAGARPLVPLRHLKPDTGLVAPGLIDVTSVPSLPDEEVFGPLLQVQRVPDFDAALATANATRYGLAAGLVSDDAALYARFRRAARAGIVNWNQPLTGASGAAPFGGIGRSGNHRPSGLFAADYCSYPVAGIEVPELKLPPQLPPGLAPA